MKASVGNRVLMLVENNSYPGDVRVRREAKTLVSAGYQVSVISPASRGQSWRETIDGVLVYRYPAPPPGSGFLGYMWEYGYSMVASFLLSLLAFFGRGFDVIHAHNPPDLFVLIALFYRVFGKRFVFDHHDLSPEMYRARFTHGGNKLVFQTLVFFEKLSCRIADHVIATNESYKKIEIERGQVPESSITVVRNGPDLTRLKLVSPDPTLRKKAPTIIGYVGVMGYQDGIDYLLRALSHLINDLGRTDFYCVLIGQGDARTSLLDLVKTLKLDDYVWFTGRVSDEELLRYLSTADICVDPDPFNPFNDRSTMIKMTEYMALEKPIVAFDLTEHRVTAQEAALFAEPNDEMDFARQIECLMDDDETRRRMGQYGRRRIETALSWSHQQRHLLEAYQKLGTHPVPVPYNLASSKTV